jgi:sugar lactone lactonase YvrE
MQPRNRYSRLWRTLSVLHLALFVSVLTVLLALAGGASAEEDPSGESAVASIPTSAEVGQAIEGADVPEMPTTDPEAAEGTALTGLGREEASELLEGVFEPELQGPAGIFDELHVKRFLAPNVALIAAGDQPEISAGAGPERPLEGTDAYSGPTLMDSTVPLGTDAGSGGLEAVDLSLERAMGGLEPTNPLVAVSIPEELGEGIHLPEAGLGIDLPDAAEEREPSTTGDDVAFYPNVATDTDLAVAPTPTGVETLTDLRSAAAPSTQTLKLELPEGSVLREEGEGAAVTRGRETLLAIPPPTAIDADGSEVPLSLSTDGDSIILAVHADPDTAYPVLVDPLFDTFEWYAKGSEAGIYEGESEDWTKWWKEPHPLGGELSYGNWVKTSQLAPTVPYGTHGLYMADLTGAVAGGEAFWRYGVPGYFWNPQPETFISRLIISDMDWRAGSSALSPYAYIGLWGPSAGWASLYAHEGLTGHSVNAMSSVLNFPNEHGVPDVKLAQVGLYSTENVSQGSTNLYVGAATVELAEPATTIPKFGELQGPAGWVNQAPAPVRFRVTDTGLGVSSVTVSAEQGSPPPSWRGSVQCFHIACPPTWVDEGTERAPAPVIQPSVLPTGIDRLKVLAEDPLGHVSTEGHIEVAVDHTAPELTFSGPLTEQTKLGTALARYPLTVTARDGTTAEPQSGAARTTIKVDGKVVDEYSPGCATENCALAREWTLESSQFEPGAHTLEAIATDSVGNSLSKTLKFQLHPTPPPVLTISGSITEQASLGIERPRYTLATTASASAQPEINQVAVPATPMLLTTFGTSGTGNGQFTNPGGVAVDSQRDSLVADTSAGRIEKFNAAGEYLGQIGSKGTGNGQLSEPAGVVVDSKGDIWVADAGNNRVDEFNEAGEYLARIGSKGTAGGQFEHPEAIAIDPKGDIWVADTRNGRLEEFNEKGEFVKVLGTKGTASGQLDEPAGISIGANGDIWVADWHNDTVLEFSEAGIFLRQLGVEGTGNGQFVHPGAVSVDNQGRVWVVDAGNDRAEVFNERGWFLNQFGSKGSGKGQFSLARPVGIASDRQGDVWVTDSANKRVERWHTVGLNYVSSFGTKGSANGQLSDPTGIARDSAGDLWVVDSGNSRVEEFTEAGTYLGKFGFKGGEKPEFFSEPTAITLDPHGDIWVADTGNNRLQEFSPTGKYLRALGSKGLGNGQFERPEGLAFDSKGNLWVSDSHGARLEEFNERGEYVRAAGAKGTSGALGEPIGISIDSENDVWVADGSKDHIAKFNERGEYLSQFGTEGSGGLQFTHPSDVFVDPTVDGAPNADVWALDSGNDRIDKTWLQVVPLGQFGSEGSAPGQFNLGHDSAFATGTEGNLWITDSGNNRVDRMHETTTHSSVATEVTVDGKPVDSGEIGCANESCSVNQEWTLDSSAYPPGKHSVVVTATDGVGRTTTKTLTIEVHRDETKPTLEASGSLFDAPMGWVEQQDYTVTGKASDAGSGATQLKLMIDGRQAGIATQACAGGGCALSNTFTIDTGEYPGGAHEAELVATDGAGNSTTKNWTINVDPEGKVSVAEVAATVEAADETSSSQILAPPSEVLDPEQIEGGDDPHLKVEGANIESTGVPDLTTMTTNPEAGFTIHSPEGSTTITPVASAGTSTSVTGGIAGVSPNTGHEVDSLIRPEYNGVQSFQEIRSESSPQAYSWEVHLGPRQKLRLANPGQAEVVYEDGTVSFLITAEPAHDATGKPVPTSLEVEGAILTLRVELKSGHYVYPVISGAGWETSYTVPVIVEGPEDETQVHEREEREQHELEEREREEREAEENGGAPPPPPPPSQVTEEMARRYAEFGPDRDPDVAPPPLPPPGAATASAVRDFQIYRSSCGHSCDWWKAKLYNATFIRHTESAEWEHGTQVHAHVDQSFLFEAVIFDTTWNCGAIGPVFVHKGSGEHLIAYAHFTIEVPWAAPAGETMAPFENNFALQDWIYPNGYQEKHVKPWDGEPNGDGGCPTVARP